MESQEQTLDKGNYLNKITLKEGRVISLDLPLLFS